MTPTRMFLCYIAAQEAQGSVLSQTLHDHGFAVFTHVLQTASVDRSASYQAQLEQADAVVVVLSPTALGSARMRAVCLWAHGHIQSHPDKQLLIVWTESANDARWPFLRSYPSVVLNIGTTIAPAGKRQLLGALDATALTATDPAMVQGEPAPAKQTNVRLRRGVAALLAMLVAACVFTLLLSHGGTGPPHGQTQANVSLQSTGSDATTPSPSQGAITPPPTALPVAGAATMTPPSHPLVTPTPGTIPTPTIAPTQTPSPQCQGKPLDRSRWSASASLTSYPPAAALDGDASSYWGTGRAQQAGDWFAIDLHATQTICIVTLLNQGVYTTYDYPNGYQLFVSQDGTNWGQPLATGAGNTGTTTITFAPHLARYVKISETVNADLYWWSICELNIEQ